MQKNTADFQFIKSKGQKRELAYCKYRVYVIIKKKHG